VGFGSDVFCSSALSLFVLLPAAVEDCWAILLLS